MIFSLLIQMLEIEELKIFVAVVASSSVSRAAVELRVPRATVSRKLAGLEERLGVRLLQRTTRSMRLTEQGRELYRHAEVVLDAANLAEASVQARRDRPSGVVRVSMPPMTGGSLPDVLADFAREYPGVCLQAHVSNRTVNLRREGYDVAIRATGALEPGLISRVLSRVSLVGVASPAYLAAHGTPASPRELRQHRCLMGFDQQERPQTHWPIMGKKTAVAGTAFSNDPHLVLRFAQRGLGIAFLPATLVAGALARGELVAVLPKQLRLQGAISVVYAERKLMAPQVRAFVDWLIERAPAALSHPSAADRQLAPFS
jgi:DNA-binding transcriptional LysR family regulator